MDDKPLIALISAVRASIPPTLDAFEAGFPAATSWNIVDDRLLEDATAQGGLTPHLELRMGRLIEHAITDGADGILLTCSLYAPVAHQAAIDADIPILAPDDGLFLAIHEGAFRNVLLVSSATGPLEDSLHRLRAITDADVQLLGVLAEDAAAAARKGDVTAVADAVVAALGDMPSDVDAIALAQFSLAPAADTIAARLPSRIPVLSGPRLAVERLRALLAQETS